MYNNCRLFESESEDVILDLNLLPVLNFEGKHLPIDVSVELPCRKGDGFRILEPIPVKGEVCNVGGCLELSLDGTAKMETLCDRCAEAFVTEVPFRAFEVIKKETPDSVEDTDEDVILLTGSSIVLEDIIYSALILHLPAKMLCKEDCKGICPVCGKNRNTDVCKCEAETTDPRFDVLDQLL